MKYIKSYEETVSDFLKGTEIDNKRLKYKEYINKYIIFEYEDTLHLGQLMRFVLNDYFVNINVFAFDDKLKNYSKHAFDQIHISDINIIKTFKSPLEAREHFLLMKATNKYNI